MNKAILAQSSAVHCFAPVHFHRQPWARNVAAAEMKKSLNTVLVLCLEVHVTLSLLH